MPDVDPRIVKLLEPLDGEKFPDFTDFENRFADAFIRLADEFSSFYTVDEALDEALAAELVVRDDHVYQVRLPATV